MHWINGMNSPASQPIGLPFMGWQPSAGLCFMKRKFDTGEVIVELGVEVCETFHRIPTTWTWAQKQRFKGLI